MSLQLDKRPDKGTRRFEAEPSDQPEEVHLGCHRKA
jgi:hypothetical protein